MLSLVDLRYQCSSTISLLLLRKTITNSWILCKCNPLSFVSAIRDECRVNNWLVSGCIFLCVNKWLETVKWTFFSCQLISYFRTYISVSIQSSPPANFCSYVARKLSRSFKDSIYLQNLFKFSEPTISMGSHLGILLNFFFSVNIFSFIVNLRWMWLLNNYTLWDHLVIRAREQTDNI